MVSVQLVVHYFPISLPVLPCLCRWRATKELVREDALKLSSCLTSCWRQQAACGQIYYGHFWAQPLCFMFSSSCYTSCCQRSSDSTLAYLHPHICTLSFRMSFKQMLTNIWRCRGSLLSGFVQLASMISTSDCTAFLYRELVCSGWLALEWIGTSCELF